MFLAQISMQFTPLPENQEETLSTFIRVMPYLWAAMYRDMITYDVIRLIPTDNPCTLAVIINVSSREDPLNRQQCNCDLQLWLATLSRDGLQKTWEAFCRQRDMLPSLSPIRLLSYSSNAVKS